MPKVKIQVVMNSSHFGGFAVESDLTQIQAWMLADREESEGTIRHELAHNIIKWKGISTKICHGKEFRIMLRKVAPETWEKDRRWTATEAIIQERSKMRIALKKYKSRERRYFACANLDCPTLYSFKNIPPYIKRGLFKRCGKCGNAGIIEVNGANAYFESIY